MNSWFTRFRISAARDEGRSLAESLQKKISANAHLGEFEARISALEHALRAARPEAVEPPFLAASIMRAVKKSAYPSAKPQRWITTLRASTIVATLMVALAFVGFWFANRPSGSLMPATNAFVSSDAALELGNTVTHTLPLVAVAPLNDELGRVDLDVTNTVRFLLANVP
jgi:hypothetical protein